MLETTLTTVSVAPNEWWPEPESMDDLSWHEPGSHGQSDQITGLTKGELALLAAHWTMRGLEDEFFIFAYQCCGKSDFSSIDNDYDRLARIDRLLGDERMAKIRKEVESQFAKRVGDDAWYAFKYGSKEDRRRFQDMMQTMMDLAFKLRDTRRSLKRASSGGSTEGL